MTRKKLPVRFTGQHFTIDKALIKEAIKQACINSNDTVLDIGAGKGYLTVHLLQKAKQVIAIEKDNGLANYLRKRFIDAQNVRVAGCDFRDYKMLNFSFKVVANIPYGITSEVLKCLMFEHVGNFTIGSVVMQSEPAKKLFSGRIYNPFTVFYHTFYDLKLLFEVSPESFFPPPTVGSALLRIERKVRAMNPELKVKYLNFVAYLLHKPELPVKTALKTLFRKKQVRSISEKFGIQLNIPIACLTADQWKNCFFEMLKVVPGKFHPK